MLGSGLVPQCAAAARGARHARDARSPATSARCPSSTTSRTSIPSTDAVAMSLARIRQLSAHEIGHTLGFAHNFAASTYGRASVMDYPAPSVEHQGRHARPVGRLRDAASARSTSSPSRYAYAQFAPGADEERELAEDPRGRASRPACSSSPTRTRVRPAPRIRSRACGTTAAIRWPRCGTRWRCAASGSRSFGLDSDPRRHAALDARGEAAAALPASPLSAAGGGEVGRRAVLHLRGEDGRQAAADPGRRDRAAGARQRDALARRARHDQGGGAGAARPASST